MRQPDQPVSTKQGLDTKSVLPELPPVPPGGSFLSDAFAKELAQAMNNKWSSDWIRYAILFLFLWAVGWQGAAWFTKNNDDIAFEVIGPLELLEGARQEKTAAEQLAWTQSLWWSVQTAQEFERNTTGVGVAAEVPGATLLPENSSDPYFLKWQQAAVNESVFGIMPSVTLIQWRIESGAGWSRLAINGNNHFGMKIGTYSTIMRAGDNLQRYLPYAPAKHQEVLGKLLEHINYVKYNFNGSSKHTDDYAAESFVNFKTPEASFAAHTLLLLFGVKNVWSGNAGVVRLQGRYLPLLSAQDYKGQLAVIKTAWYATEESYHIIGINGIQKSWINQLDRVVDLRRNVLIEEAVMWYFAWSSK